mgnify:FL=1
MCGAFEPVHASKLGAQLHSWYKVIHKVTPLHLQEQKEMQDRKPQA